MLTRNNNYPNKAGVFCRQRSPSEGRASKVQSIGQLIQQRIGTYYNSETTEETRFVGSNGEEGIRSERKCHGGGGTVQLVDSNNNAEARHKFGCWKDKNCIGEGTEKWVDAVDDEQNQFRCCAVCGGRIWQGVDKDKISPILGDCQHQHLLKLDGGEELLVHSACFRCATCGLDLLGEQEQQVVKRADRFYCALHGQQQQLKQLQQQQKEFQQQCQKQNVIVNDNGTFETASKRPLMTEHRLSNGAVQHETSWNMRTTKTTADDCIQDNNNNNNNNGKSTHNDGHNIQKWWERRAEEFNGGKGSTTFRYYGHNIDQRDKHKQRPTAKAPPPKPMPPIVSTDINKVPKGGVGGAVQAQSGDGGGHRRMEMVLNARNKGNNKGGTSASEREENAIGREHRKKSSAKGEERCEQCGIELSGSFVLAKGRCWCPEHFVCANSACARRLLESGFVEEPQSRKNYCPICYECLIAPVCRKCFLPLTETCLNALGEKWHNECFTCTQCRKPFGTLSFFVEDGKPYCEYDWNLLFTTKCSKCLKPIKVGQKWLEALGGQFHADCFECATCGTGLEGKTYFERGQQPFCRIHATATSAAI